MTRTLGPYEIRSKLGRGVATVLWRAYDPVLAREVALREPVIPHDLDSSAVADFLARFLQVGRAASALSHPGLVKVHAAEVYYGRPLLAMELVEGENLAQVLARGPLSTASALYVLDQLLEAVAYAHAQGVTHESITAESVLVTREGRVKIADFGTARLYEPLAGEAKGVTGAPGYAAPEQLTSGKVDRRADLFAIGVLGYEMLAGANPFGASEGLGASTVSHRTVHEAPATFPPEALQGAKTDLRAVLGAALAKDPERRFQTADEFRAALHGAPAPAGTVPLALAARRPAAAGGAAAAGGLVAVEPRLHVGGRGGRPAPKPRRRRLPAPILGVAAFLVVCAVALGLFFGLGGDPPGGTTTSASASAGSSSSATSTSVAPVSSSSTALTLVPGTTTTTTLPPPTTSTTTTVAPTTTAQPTTTVAPSTTTTRRPTTTTQRPTTTTQRPTTTTQPVTPTTLGPGS